MEASKSKNVISRVWLKVPLVFRAVFIGLGVSTIGVLSWSVIATIIPMPWAFLVSIGFLWVYYNYFSGSRWQERSKEVRQINFRKNPLTKAAWAYGLAGTLFIVAIEQSGLVVTFRVIEFPAEQFTAAYSFLDGVPVWAAWLVIIMISAVAAVAEETGFRGYMSVPLEKRYGPLITNAIVSIVFVLVHLHQAWSGPIIVHVFLISALFGIIAYASDSLLPGMVGHFIMDIFNFSFWWTKVGNQFSRKTIAETGIDLHFILWVVFLLLSTVAFIYIIRRLKGIRTLVG